MSVVLALGASELTTQEIHARLPEVAQASLYRAVARLVDAEVIEVVAEHRKGGAVERVFRAAAPQSPAGEPLPAETIARAEAIAAALTADVARCATSVTANPMVPTLRRDLATVPRERVAGLARDVAALVEAATVAPGTDGAVSVAVTLALVPLTAEHSVRAE